MSDGLNRKPVRRRRTWYRRRLRMQRILVAVFVGTVLAAACWQNAAHHLSLPTLHASQILPDSFWRRDFHADFASASSRFTRAKNFRARIPGVYPYSIIPGAPPFLPFRLRPCSTRARHRSPRSLSFVSRSRHSLLDAQKSSSAPRRTTADRRQDHGASALRQPDFRYRQAPGFE